MRLVLVGAAALVLLAGCGSKSAAPRTARLPASLARQLAAESDAVASALDAGSGCSALTRARQLQSDTIAAINARRVPASLAEPLQGASNELVARIVCTPPVPAATPAPAATSTERSNGNGHGKQHKGEGKHKDKGD
ncbi:MAG: hypothetical protein ACR2MU_02315 [Gaiellaceae bacterium]